MEKQQDTICKAGLQSKVEVKLQLVQSSEGAERGKLNHGVSKMDGHGADGTADL
ncbi:hypothetical protein NQZ68_013978 [Dissostichus eleginoides]|nr:hypothetical protein NQZ68_013978 [Dissostichus eleginoides]